MRTGRNKQVGFNWRPSSLSKLPCGVISTASWINLVCSGATWLLTQHPLTVSSAPHWLNGLKLPSVPDGTAREPSGAPSCILQLWGPSLQCRQSYIHMRSGSPLELLNPRLSLNGLRSLCVLRSHNIRSCCIMTIFHWCGWIASTHMV